MQLGEPFGVAATKRRDTADFDVDDAVCSTCAPTGSSATGYRRVEMPASMRATMPSASWSAAANVV